MKKTKFKNIDLTVTKQYRVICTEKDYKGDWTNDYTKALEELTQHQRDTEQTHQVKVEVRVIKTSSYNAEQFQLLQ
ncbi:hypothetical protein [Flavobacterium sp. JAS]|uniref:hypothetical protein n=1 Tax=Flavobacterium sp. JAS TaxID=2897329 RepID=UPI001E28AF1C|nr:hypothetical protein [Flavobacterium sp. JAS]MCD0472533.1 hypothetical protein [Flavobacterium sp. JAS]